VTDSGKGLLSSQFYVGIGAQYSPYGFAFPVFSGQEMTLMNIGQGEIAQTDNNGVQSLSYAWDKGISQDTFAPKWNDHGTVIATYIHTWNQTAIQKAQPQPGGDGPGMDVTFTGGNDDLTASSPKGSY
jgi:hypothetical protein